MFFSSCDSLVGDSLEFKQIEAPYVFDWENAIALHAMQGNRASSARPSHCKKVWPVCGKAQTEGPVSFLI